ncbi:MAG TPA: YihY/virulence factor BrkB family protein [Candidatus Limnocylindrales bacterium]
MRDTAMRIGKRLLAEVQRDDVPGMSAELAYRFLFAVFPFGIFVAALAAFVAQWAGITDPSQKIIGAVTDNLPPDIAAAIAPQIQAVIGTTRPGLLTFGAIAALWAASGGTNSLMKAMNKAYEVDEDRSFLPKTALAVGLTLLATVGLLVAFVTIVGASILTTGVSQQLGLDQSAVGAISLLRWPLVFVLVSLAVAVLYKLAPNARIPFRWCLAGGALFAVGWLIATGVFGLYVANFSSYANTYGALGGVIVLMLWFYLSAFILVGAAALIAVVLKETRPAAVQPRPGSEKANEPAEPRPAVAARPAAATLAVSRMAPRPPSAAIRARVARRRVEQPPPSTPADWALAAGVATVGASLGVIAAWLVGDRSRAG